MRVSRAGLIVPAVTVALVGPAGRAPAQTAPRPSEPVSLVAQQGTRFTQTDAGLDISGGRGLLRTNRFFADFVLRFQFSLAEPETEAVVFARSLVPTTADPPTVGYRVHLSARKEGRVALGRVTGWRQGYVAEPTATATLTPAPGEWHDCELRVVGKELTVTINGIRTTTATNLEQLVGYVGFRSDRGRLRVRRVQIDTLPAAGNSPPTDTLELSDGIQNPSVIKDMRPVYSIEAMRERVQGVVVMRIVIRDDGTVGNVEVVKPLHPDLDQSAIAAARQWLFRPAMKGGQPVAVYVTLEMNFRMFN